MEIRNQKSICQIIDRITRVSQPNNESFTFKGLSVNLHSGTEDYVVATITNMKDNEILVGFTLDFWLKEVVHNEGNEEVFSVVENHLKTIYPNLLAFNNR